MAWTLLTHTAKASSASSLTVTTDAIDTTGATLIVLIATGEMTTNPPFITDSQSNTNYYQTLPRYTSGNYGIMIQWIVNPTTNASHTFQLSGGAAMFPALAVACFSGSYGGAELTTKNYVTSSNTVAPGSITPSSNDALLVTGYSNNSGTGTNTIDASFTVTDTVIAAANGGPVAMAYLIQTSAAAANPTWTTTGATVNSVGIMTSFLLRPSAGGSAGGSYAFAG